MKSAKILLLVIVFFAISCTKTQIVIKNTREETRPYQKPVKTDKVIPAIKVVPINYKEMLIKTYVKVIGLQYYEKREIKELVEEKYFSKERFYNGLILSAGIFFLGLAILSKKTTSETTNVLLSATGAGFSLLGISGIYANTDFKKIGEEPLPDEIGEWEKDGSKEVVISEKEKMFPIKAANSDFRIVKYQNKIKLSCKNDDFIFFPNKIKCVNKKIFSNLVPEKLKLYLNNNKKYVKKINFYSIKRNIHKIQKKLNMHYTKFTIKNNNEKIDCTIEIIPLNLPPKLQYIKKFIYNSQVAKSVANSLDNYHTNSIEFNSDDSIVLIKNYKYRIKAYFYGSEILNRTFTYNKIKQNLIFHVSPKKYNIALRKAEESLYNKMANLYQEIKHYKNEYLRKKREIQFSSSYYEIQSKTESLYNWYNSTVLPAIYTFSNYMAEYSNLFGQTELAWALKRMGYSDYIMNFSF